MPDDWRERPFGNYQFEVYLKGMSGEMPDFPMGWAELEAQASAGDGPRRPWLRVRQRRHRGHRTREQGGVRATPDRAAHAA